MADRVPLHDFARSRAVVMGTSDYAHLTPVPAAANSLERMTDLLTGPWCEWPRERLLTLLNERDPGVLPDRLITAFEDVTDVALFYYVGHGQIDLDDQLCLGLVGSRLEPNRRAATSLPFQAVRRALLDSPAVTKIVILDCCFAGLANLPANTLAAFPGEVLDMTAGTGAYTLAASGPYTTAWYETGPQVNRPQTYFTRYLADLVEAGMPGQAPVLRLHSLFTRLRDKLESDGRPAPRERSIDAARDFIFARNAAPPETHRDPDLEFRLLTERLAEAEARRAREWAAAEAREQALRAEAAELTRELERLREQARHSQSLDAVEQRELNEAIRTTERRLDETTAAEAIAATEHSGIVPATAPQQPAGPATLSHPGAEEQALPDAEEAEVASQEDIPSAAAVSTTQAADEAGTVDKGANIPIAIDLAAAAVGRQDTRVRDQTAVSPQSSPDATPQELPGPLPRVASDQRRTGLKPSRHAWAWAAGAFIAAGVTAAAILVEVTSNHTASQTSNHTASQPTASVGYGAAISSVINPSNHRGGTITYDNSSTPDSTDPGNTYFNSNWDFTRLYAMPLMTYKSCPGSCGLQVVPDLATAPGTVSDNGLTWTYHIQPDVKFEDGTTVTSQDVKYAVERTFDRTVLTYGPAYFQTLLGGNAASYSGPYKDRAKNLMGLTAIDTPDPTTIVFHLAHPFSDFDYVVAIPQTAPVPPSKDTRGNYQLHPISTGPYMFQSYQLNKQLTLVPNPHWNPATDPSAKQAASKIIVNLNVNQADIDNRLLAGDIGVDAAGTGVATAAQARILSNPTLKANADNPINGLSRFAYLNTKVAPMDNLHCRMAVEYAANKVTAQTAWGGPIAGAIASTVMPPNIIGYQRFDLYNALSEPTGDLTAAKQQLAMCGHPNGFTTNLAYRSDRPKDVAAATALQASLARVGIKVTPKGLPALSYYTNATAPAYVHSHGIGIVMGSWSADWPDGFGFLDSLAAGNTIVATGNTNIEELNDPAINNLFAKSSTLTGAARTAIWGQIDQQIMKDAGILPLVYEKTLLYRPPSLTNVYVQAYYGMYDYAVLGMK